MIALDYTFMTEGAVAGGITDAALRSADEPFAAALAVVNRRRTDGELGFLDLPDDQQQVRYCNELAQWATDRGVRDVVVLGIGGSALGPIALRTALRSPAWNALSPSNRDGRPRLHVLDNVDPATIRSLLDRLELGATLFIVTSKSGGTAETMAQYLVVRQWLEEALGAAAYRHLVFTTDPERGALRELAEREGIATLSVPPGVGGRFSVLSPVGLLPAALVGIDIEGLLTGAGRAVERAAADDLLRNPPALYAALHWAADADLGARIHVLMPYSDRLREFAEWYRQLWAESLGKRVDREGRTVHVGPTPVGAIGATDQHSQVQLFMEGPFDKVITFAVVERQEEDLPIPPRADLPPDLAYLPGHSLGELLRAEYEATSSALAQRGRMSCTLRLPDLSAETLGEAIMFFQLATGYAGVWYGIDPFDQPGVELGKRLTYAAMGRPGYETPPAAPEDTDVV